MTSLGEAFRKMFRIFREDFSREDFSREDFSEDFLIFREAQIYHGRFFDFSIFREAQIYHSLDVVGDSVYGGDRGLER